MSLFLQNLPKTFTYQCSLSCPDCPNMYKVKQILQSFDISLMSEEKQYLLYISNNI